MRKRRRWKDNVRKKEERENVDNEEREGFEEKVFLSFPLSPLFYPAWI